MPRNYYPNSFGFYPSIFFFLLHVAEFFLIQWIYVANKLKHNGLTKVTVLLRKVLHCGSGFRNKTVSSVFIVMSNFPVSCFWFSLV